MGTQSLITRANGNVIDQSWFNLFNQVLEGDFVPRNGSGVPASAAGNLGSALYPWGTAFFNSLNLGGSTFNGSQLETSPFSITSGRTRSSSNQPSFIVAAGGSTLQFTVKGASTPLIFNCNGTPGQISTDIVVSATAAPSSNNTATLNDNSFAGQAVTRTYGEYGVLFAGGGSPLQSVLTISSAGTHFVAGTYQAFKIGTEYFFGYIDSTTQISRCYRGFFFDSSENPVKRATFSNGATVTIMNLGWVFADTDGVTLDVIFTGAGVNNSPISSFSTPTSPVTGDYWYDLGNNLWKRYNGSSFVSVSRILIGVVVADTTGCKAARSFDFFSVCRVDSTIELAQTSNTVMKTLVSDQRVNVKGNRIAFTASRATWDTSVNLAASTERYNASVTASTTEYFYVTDKGETKISDFEPYWRPDLLGYYHPHNPWRCVASNAVDGSAHFTSAGTINYYGIKPPPLSITGDEIAVNTVTGGASGSGNIALATVTPANLAATNGGVFPTSSSSYSNNALSPTTVTGAGAVPLSISLNVSGNRPVLVGIQPDGSGNAFLGTQASAGGIAFVSIFRDSAKRYSAEILADNTTQVLVPPGVLTVVDADVVGSPGSHTWVFQIWSNNAQSVYAFNCKIYAFEL